LKALRFISVPILFLPRSPLPSPRRREQLLAQPPEKLAALKTIPISPAMKFLADLPIPLGAVLQKADALVEGGAGRNAQPSRQTALFWEWLPRQCARQIQSETDDFVLISPTLRTHFTDAELDQLIGFIQRRWRQIFPHTGTARHQETELASA